MNHAWAKHDHAVNKPLLAMMFGFIVSGAFVWAEPPVVEWRRVANKSFMVGEYIGYEIKYGYVPSGSASLQVSAVENVNGRQAYHIVSNAKSNRTLDKIFKVRDRNDSWMDVESLCSLRFSQNIREGAYRKETMTVFDQAGGTFNYAHKGKPFDSREGQKIPRFVQDVLSSLYYIRTLDLKEGGEYQIDANSAGKTWPLKVFVRGIEKVKVPAGSFECFRVEPVLAGEGIFDNKGRLEVWMTKDKRKIPILLKSQVLVGSFDAAMKEYSVLGQPLSALADDD